MRVETQDLHGITLEEAIQKTRQSINWCLRHGVDVLVLNHGKGHHSDRGFSVIKKQIRKILKEDEILRGTGYKVVYGESNLPIALTFNEGNTLIVARGKENEYLGGKNEQEKNKRVFSDESIKERKAQKKMRKTKPPHGR